MDARKTYIKEWERLFLIHRPYLVSFAFRMTGSLSEAEDIVQDTFLSCAEIDPTQIQNHRSWLTKVCSNKGLDYLKSSHKKRESYIGPWLPDAIPDSFHIGSHLGEDISPEKNLLLSESLTTSFLLLVDRLNPEERVVYLLSEVFDYSFKEIASFINKSEEACRKIAERARKSILTEKPKFNANPSNAEKLIAQFFASARAGDKESLMNLLSDDSEFWSDGGGKVSASRFVLTDKAKTAAFFAGIASIGAFTTGPLKIEYKQVNSRPGMVISRQLPSGEWIFETIMSFEIANEKITRIYAQRNPDKLSTLLNLKGIN